MKSGIKAKYQNSFKDKYDRLKYWQIINLIKEYQ